MPLTYSLSAAPVPADIAALEGALNGYFAALDAATADTPLLALARDEAGAVVAGLAAKTGWDQMYIRTLHVAEPLRGQGVGARLMAEAEAEGRRRGCIVSWLMCSTPEAKRFYEGRGYTCFGEVERRAPKPARWFMKKALV